MTFLLISNFKKSEGIILLAKVKKLIFLINK
jgi:hypothetical protein